MLSYLKGVFRRVAPRAFVMFLLTAFAFYVMEPLTIATNTPEVMKVLQVVAVLSWIRFSVWVMRVTLAPRINHQSVGIAAAKHEAHGATYVYLALTVESLLMIFLAVKLYLAP